jgi:hypothetical protein
MEEELRHFYPVAGSMKNEVERFVHARCRLVTSSFSTEWTTWLKEMNYYGAWLLELHHKINLLVGSDRRGEM